MKLPLAFALSLLATIGASTQSSSSNTAKVEAVAIVSNEQNPSRIAVDEQYVYWVSDGGRTIKRVSKAGGVPTTLLTSQFIHEILVDEENIFFTVLGEIRRVSKSGGTPVTLVKSELISFSLFPMVVDKTNLYYYEEIEVPPGKVDKNPLLRKVSKAGGVPVTLSSRTYLVTGPATDGTNAYWADRVSDTVKSISVNGGRTTTLGRCIGPMAIAVDAANVYCWNGTIVKFKKAIDTSVQMSGVHGNAVRGLLMDERHLYLFASYKEGRGIYRIAKSGGQRELLAPLELWLYDFAVDDTSIYWTNEHEGTVMRQKK